jgi:Transposase DNA-binding/Transposase DDE domain
MGPSVKGREFVEAELGNADLGDARRTARLTRVATAIVSDPSASFPDSMVLDADLEGTYRFLSNPRVTPDAVLAPHLRATAKRIAAESTVVIAHDTTEFTFGSFPRGDLKRTGRGDSYGFCAHVSLALTADERRLPLGVVGLHRFNRTFGASKVRNGKYKSDPSNTMLRWGEQVRAVHDDLADPSRVIHVMDREADDYTLLAQMQEDGQRFVVRQSGDRRQHPDHRFPKVRDALAIVAVVATREVPLTARRPITKKAHRSRYPTREGRVAELEFRAATVSVARTDTASKDVPRQIELNVVHVLEINAPPGCEPVEWWLWTSDPIGNAEEILAVVDAYRCRWTIEEFFKALKTGCAFEKRQLESAHALANALSIFAPIAWRLLLLRTLARHADAPATAALTTTQIKCLRAFTLERLRRTLPDVLSARDAMLAVAKMGGHITNNGDPGWIVLGRGFDRLLDVELGFSLARSDQS